MSTQPSAHARRVGGDLSVLQELKMAQLPVRVNGSGAEITGAPRRGAVSFCSESPNSAFCAPGSCALTLQSLNDIIAATQVVILVWFIQLCSWVAFIHSNHNSPLYLFRYDLFVPIHIQLNRFQVTVYHCVLGNIVNLFLKEPYETLMSLDSAAVVGSCSNSW
jgi:hypothetical protein